MTYNTKCEKYVSVQKKPIELATISISLFYPNRPIKSSEIVHFSMLLELEMITNNNEPALSIYTRTNN